MAQHVFVKNEGSEKYSEVFRGKKIEIPSGGRVRLQRREAISFIGTMSPPNRDGIPVEKKLVIEVDSGQNKKVPDPDQHICHMDGKEFNTKEELEAHLKQFEDKTVTIDEVNNKVGNALRKKKEAA